MESIGKTVVDKSSDALWYLDSHHEKCKNWHLVINITFTIYQGFNDYWKNRISKPHVQATELNARIGSLVFILGMPWILKKKNSEVRISWPSLVKSMRSYHDFLVGMQQRTADNRSTKEHCEESCGYTDISGKKGPVPPNYLPLQNELLPSMLHFW